MKAKKPSLRGMRNCDYLGHFRKDKYISEGHNTSGGVIEWWKKHFGSKEAKTVQGDVATKRQKLNKLIWGEATPTPKPKKKKGKK